MSKELMELRLCFCLVLKPYVYHIQKFNEKVLSREPLHSYKNCV